MFRPKTVLVMGAAMLVASATAALAADGTVTAGPLVSLVTPYLQALAEGVITALIGFATYQLKQRTGIEIDAKRRETLHSAAETGVKLGLSKLQSLADAYTLEGKAAVLATATGWMGRAAGDAIGHFGLDPSSVESLAESKLSGMLADLSAAKASTVVNLSPPAGGGLYAAAGR